MRRAKAARSASVGLLGSTSTPATRRSSGLMRAISSNNVHDSQFGDSAKGDGWQIGAYAVYDPGAFYVKGVTTYSSLNGNSTRHINFAGLAHRRDASLPTRGKPRRQDVDLRSAWRRAAPDERDLGADAVLQLRLCQRQA